MMLLATTSMTLVLKLYDASVLSTFNNNRVIKDVSPDLAGQYSEFLQYVN